MLGEQGHVGFTEEQHKLLSKSFADDQDGLKGEFRKAYDIAKGSELTKLTTPMQVNATSTREYRSTKDISLELINCHRYLCQHHD